MEESGREWKRVEERGREGNRGEERVGIERRTRWKDEHTAVLCRGRKEYKYHRHNKKSP